MSSPVAVPPSIGFAPGRLPLLGHAFALRYRPLEFLHTQRSKGDIVVFWIGPSRAYLVNSPDLIRQMLTTHRADFSKGGVIDIGRMLTGDGLISSDNDLHRKQRRLIQPAFHPHHFPAYTMIMQEAATTKVDSWQDNQVIRVDHEMHELSTATLVRCLYSGHLSDGTIGEIARSLPVAFDGLGRRAALPFRWLHALPTPQNRRFNSAVDRLHRIVDQLITDRKAGGADQKDVLSILLTTRDEETGQAMPDQQIHDEIMTLLVAGSDTTAVTLSWALHIIGAHPSIENKIHIELQQVLGGRPVTHADLPRLDFLHRVVTETLRLYPPGWLVPRRATIDTDLGGHHITRGSYVFYSPYANHHDPLLFPGPERFDPDRWLPERAQPLPQCAYIPFGAGTRQCIGNTFAVTEVIAALATILPRWRLRPHPDKPVRPHALTTLTPGRLPMITERRTGTIDKD
ncbi:MAG: cytochrome P450 [Pseudonocardiaceae bacterium]